MKKAFAAALTISLLAGTSALAQERPQRGEWHARVVQHREDAQKQQQEDRRPDRQESEETRPARPVPQVANPRAQEAIAEARARQAQHDAVVVERRNDRANDAILQARARQEERRTEEQRHVVPHVITQAQQNRYERRDDDNREQRVYIRPDTRHTNDTAARRDEVERRLREADRSRDRDHDGDRYHRPSQIRDRDHNRHWYSPSQWQRSYWAQHRYRVSPYRYPSGWYVRTWVFGDRLPHAWYGQTYYLDWWRYRLPMPPIGAEWVRVGDDALLVDTWSGRVLSVYYDLFW